MTIEVTEQRVRRGRARLAAGVVGLVVGMLLWYKDCPTCGQPTSRLQLRKRARRLHVR